MQVEFCLPLGDSSIRPPQTGTFIVARKQSSNYRDSFSNMRSKGQEPALAASALSFALLFLAEFMSLTRDAIVVPEHGRVPNPSLLAESISDKRRRSLPRAFLSYLRNSAREIASSSLAAPAASRIIISPGSNGARIR